MDSCTNIDHAPSARRISEEELREKALKRVYLTGLLMGLAASFTWGLYNVGTTMGKDAGMRPADMTILRYGIAGLLFLPMVIKHFRVLPSVKQLAILALLNGPIFAMLFYAGFRYAPLSHAVVIGPGVTMLVATGLNIAFHGERLKLNRIFGMSLLFMGLMAIGVEAAEPTTKEKFWIGDILFLCSSSLWGIQTYLLGRWKLPAIPTTGCISLVSTALILPVYLVYWGVPSHPVETWLFHGTVHGILGGALAFVLYAGSINRIGGSQAALFTATVPMLAILLAIPLLSQVPSALQWTSVLLATFGLILSQVKPRRRAKVVV